MNQETPLIHESAFQDNQRTAGPVSYTAVILRELEQALGSISPAEADQLADAVLQARKIMIAGAGRSGLMGKAFAMRLMHMGLDAHVVGETTTPNLETGDLFLLVTGSGETGSLISMAHKAKRIGAAIAAITLNPASTIGELADLTVQLHGASKDQGIDSQTTIQPMGSLFEQSLFLFGDALILALMQRKGLDTHKMYGKHANLE